MEPLYLKAFGLAREPFNITPNPRFLFLSESHKEALAQLVYGIKARRGFVVLTGEVGTGKTTLINCLLDELNGSTKTALVFNMIVGPQDLLRYVCEKFGLVTNGDHRKPLHDYISLLENFLLESYGKSQNVALIIDEAQNLSAGVLENVRLLSNFETPRDKLLQILLVGQPELGDRLNRNDMRQIKQRVALHHHLSALSFSDCEKYTAKRLEIAGGNLSLFSTEAIEAVYSYSAGIPRLINILCDNGLLAAYAVHKERVDRDMIEQIAQDLQLTNPIRPSAPAKESAIGPEESSHPIPREARSHRPDPPNNPGPAQPMAVPAAEGIQLCDGATTFEPPNAPGVSTASRPTSRTELVSVPGSKTETIPPRFFDHMILSLTDAMGPMAPIVLHDQVAAMGEAIAAFPKERIFQLLNQVSQEILADTLRLNFLRLVHDEIATLKVDHQGG
jgi:type II secretory pathway predicted ATPase ExeA